MPLSNSQYNAIMRMYEEKQRKSRYLLEQRKDAVYQQIPEYEELDHQVSSTSIAQARKMLSGDSNALSELKEKLAWLSRQKTSLLTAHGYPADYLEPVYECPLCKDTGYVNNHKCTCFRQAEISLIYEQSHIKELLETDNFDHLSYEFYQGEDLTRFTNAVRENFSTLSYEYYQGEDLKHFEAAVGLCRKFVQNFKQDYHNLFFYGTVGTGKSFLSSCIAKELIEQGKLVIYFSSAQLFETLSRSTFDRNSEEAASGIYEDIYECDLLIIDDLGTELTNAFVSSQLFSCLNNRHLRRKSTIITTNLSLEELRDRYSDRIFSRITSNYGMCKLTGHDIRITKKLLLNRK